MTTTDRPDDRSMTFAYADPPYFGMGKKMYGDKHPEAHIWDTQEAHVDLLEKLAREYPDGWAYCTNPKELYWQLPHCPEGTRIAAWVKTWHQIRPTTTQFAWEAVLWCSQRKDPKRPMVRDWVSGVTARQRGLQGAKPSYFNRWILDLLAYREGDVVVDLFPGTDGMADTLSQATLPFHAA